MKTRVEISRKPRDPRAHANSPEFVQIVRAYIAQDEFSTGARNEAARVWYLGKRFPAVPFGALLAVIRRESGYALTREEGEWFLHTPESA